MFLRVLVLKEELSRALLVPGSEVSVCLSDSVYRRIPGPLCRVINKICGRSIIVHIALQPYFHKQTILNNYKTVTDVVLHSPLSLLSPVHCCH